MNISQRRPRWRRFRRQQRRPLPPDRVPQTTADLDPACTERFDRFTAMRRESAPGARLPIEFEVLLVAGGPGTVTIWTPPTDRVEATLVGRLTGAAVAAYETVLAELDRDMAPIAWLTAHELAPGRYHALVEGWPL